MATRTASRSMGVQTELSWNEVNQWIHVISSESDIDESPESPDPATSERIYISESVNNGNSDSSGLSTPGTQPGAPPPPAIPPPPLGPPPMLWPQFPHDYFGALGRQYCRWGGSKSYRGFSSNWTRLGELEASRIRNEPN